MNAKKIMGAVLVALLAAALFVGAGAAVEETGKGTIFLYQKDLGTAYDSTYTCGDSTVVIKDGVVSTTDLSKFVNGGKYTNGTAYFYVKLPNAGFTAVGETTGTEKYDAMANGVFAGDKVTFTAVPDATIGTFEYAKFIIYTPKGNPLVYASGPAFDATAGTLEVETTGFAKGTYQIQAVFSDTTGFAEITPNEALAGQLYNFEILSAKGAITASADTVISGNVISVTITGEPEAVFSLDIDGFNWYAAQPAGTAAGTESNGVVSGITLPNDGKITIYLIAGDDGKNTLTLYDSNNDKAGSVDITVQKGSITASADADYFFIGNPILLSGEMSVATPFLFYIEGTNFAFTPIDVLDVDDEYDAVKGIWSAEIDSLAIETAAGNGQMKGLVAGGYTIFVTNTPAQTKEALMDGTYATVSVNMKQPFISNVEAAPVAIQGDDEYTITGMAEAADKVRLYVFGTSFFTTQEKNTDKGEFKFKLNIEDDTTDVMYMAPGTYFYLIQHPMNDELFNVWVNETADFYYAATNPALNIAPGENAAAYDDANFIFNAFKRGTNYAAQALLNEISGQNIDDIFVQGTFEVEAQKLTINPIPAEVAKGTALTVSGYSNSGKGTEVIVNVLAGKFGATVKGDSNEAIFLTAKAVTKEDGTFEAAIDTSKLELGNYIVTVEIDQTTYDTAAVEIVAAADKPDTPVDPVDPVDPKPVDPQPTEPETPGFGALAALAGLGAVAVLLLRRE